MDEVSDRGVEDSRHGIAGRTREELFENGDQTTTIGRNRLQAV
jgi:hypothetical protein